MAIELAITDETPEQLAGDRIPPHRGYVLFGAGAYLLTICKGDERGPELVAHLATEEEKVGRVVGDLGDVVEDKAIPLDRVAVRLQFLSEAGLRSLEQQLRMLRAEYFPSVPGEEVLGYISAEAAERLRRGLNAGVTITRQRVFNDDVELRA
jgi:hypothetical protein